MVFISIPDPLLPAPLPPPGAGRPLTFREPCAGVAYAAVAAAC
jgi:hypothetical protein